MSVPLKKIDQSPLFDVQVRVGNCTALAKFFPGELILEPLSPNNLKQIWKGNYANSNPDDRLLKYQTPAENPGGI
jgi:hypothetical protein